MTRISKYPALAAAALAAVLLSGCASAPPAPKDDIVKQRAEARWEAIFARDYAAAYEYYSPGYKSKNSAVDLEISMRMQKVRWTSTKYLDHSCEDKICSVRFDLRYTVATPVPGVEVWNGFDTIEEQWIKTGGEWWYVPKYW